ncbi:MAG: citrate transporter [Firmicutes bacterium]|nr:citrate transporter [Bacillota bacterium]
MESKIIEKVNKVNLLNVFTQFIKSQVVLLCASLVALISCFFVHPSLNYLKYIDTKVILLLLCLMLVISGFIKLNLFSAAAVWLLKRTKNTRELALVLIALCFFSSMLITNDVALIAFVPFTLSVLFLSGKEKFAIGIITLQTAAANIGSTMTPVGNPQNLYLYSFYNIVPADFFTATLPVVVIGGLLVFTCILAIKNEPVDVTGLEIVKISNTKELVLYSALFLLTLLSVFNIVNYVIASVLLMVIVFIADKRLYKQADYSLLLTFICFFIFVGNARNMPDVINILGKLISGREMLITILISQFISNVPAAVMLSGFTNNYSGLLVGANIGGMGTLVASLASLISFRIYCKSNGSKPGKYLLVFTIVNFALLAIMVILFILFKQFKVISLE